MTKTEKENALKFAKHMQTLAKKYNVNPNEAYMNGLFMCSDLTANFRTIDTMLLLLEASLSFDEGTPVLPEEKLEKLKRDFGAQSKPYCIAKAIIEAERAFNGK